MLDDRLRFWETRNRVLSLAPSVPTGGAILYAGEVALQQLLQVIAFCIKDAVNVDCV